MFMSTLLSALLSTTPAQALSCMEGVFDSSPDMDVITLPANGKIIVWNAASFDVTGFSDTLELVDEDTGQLIDIELQAISSTVTEVLPVEPLNSDHMYVLRTNWGNPEETWSHAAFVLENNTDLTAPEQPSILSSERDYGTWEWGDWDKQHISVDASVDTAYFKVELSSSPDFHISETILEKSLTGVISIGYDECHSNIHAQEIGEMTHVRIKAVDFAGNESEWSNVFDLDASEPGPSGSDKAQGGCSSLSSPASPALLLLGAAMLGWRRREN